MRISFRGISFKLKQELTDYIVPLLDFLRFHGIKKPEDTILRLHLAAIIRVLLQKKWIMVPVLSPHTPIP